jgi:hypothetical protein
MSERGSAAARDAASRTRAAPLSGGSASTNVVEDACGVAYQGVRAVSAANLAWSGTPAARWARASAFARSAAASSCTAVGSAAMGARCARYARPPASATSGPSTPARTRMVAMRASASAARARARAASSTARAAASSFSTFSRLSAFHTCQLFFDRMCSDIVARAGIKRVNHGQPTHAVEPRGKTALIKFD